MSIEALIINRVTQEQIPAAVEFMVNIRNEVFPMFQTDQLPKDIRYFEQYYMEPDNASFFVASDHKGRVIGTVGVLGYDDRIDAIRGRYNDNRVAEIVRCYVDPAARRAGIGSRLFREAADFSKEAGYSTLYLHTHRFLGGAVEFWQCQGFSIALDQRDPWKTVHMERRISFIE